MDGPKEMHDQLRVFSNGRGSYDIIEPKVRALIQNHRTRPITARVTLTAGVSDVIRIFRHLKQDLGFHEVGFAPVTTSPNQLYAINATGMDSVLDQFHTLADEYLEYAAARRIARILERQRHAGRALPGRQQIASLRRGPGAARRGAVRRHRAVPSLCRFRCARAGPHLDRHRPREAEPIFCDRGHIDAKYDCHTCWARPLCAGGCHHEAFVRYGDTGHPNLHYCDWIRDWTDTCLEIYGAIAAKNPGFLQQFAERKAS